MVGLARSLEYAHSRGVGHLDVKPDNVMVSVDETLTLFVRLVDFGSARLTGAFGGQQLSTITCLAITPDYAAPEAIAAATASATGRAPPAVTLQADIYSFGLLALEMVTGEPATLLVRYKAAHLADAVRAASPWLPAGVVRALVSCVEVEPAARPTASQLRQCLEEAAQLRNAPHAPQLLLQIFGRVINTVRLVRRFTALIRLLRPSFQMSGHRDVIPPARADSEVFVFDVVRNG
jgi:serine/threonine protein kinase